MEALSFDNILGEQEIETLFTDPEDNEVQKEHKEAEEEEVETPGSDDKKQKEKLLMLEGSREAFKLREDKYSI